MYKLCRFPNRWTPAPHLPIVYFFCLRSSILSLFIEKRSADSVTVNKTPTFWEGKGKWCGYLSPFISTRILLFLFSSHFKILTFCLFLAHRLSRDRHFRGQVKNVLLKGQYFVESSSRPDTDEGSSCEKRISHENL